VRWLVEDKGLIYVLANALPSITSLIAQLALRAAGPAGQPPALSCNDTLLHCLEHGYCVSWPLSYARRRSGSLSVSYATCRRQGSGLGLGAGARLAPLLQHARLQPQPWPRQLGHLQQAPPRA
jgi:hypothetical protein